MSTVADCFYLKKKLSFLGPRLLENAWCGQLAIWIYMLNLNYWYIKLTSKCSWLYNDMDVLLSINSPSGKHSGFFHINLCYPRLILLRFEYNVTWHRIEVWDDSIQETWRYQKWPTCCCHIKLPLCGYIIYHYFFFYVIKNQLNNLYPLFIVRIVFLVLGG
jgi:hypothetical protein